MVSYTTIAYIRKIRSLWAKIHVNFVAITKEEENFEEAVKAINSCFGGGKPTSRLQEILNDPACNQLTKEVNFIYYLTWYKTFIRKVACSYDSKMKN